MPQFSATRGEWRMQLGAPAAHGTLLRGRDSVARTLRTGGSNHSRTSTMSIPVAHDRAAPVGDVDAAQNLAALLPIGPELKARIRVLIVDDEHTLLVARETSEQRTQLERRHAHSDKITLLGTAPAFQRAIELARKVAPTDASVFITGESGSGKELIAQFIHHNSRRSSRPFVAVNCAALPEGLLESEMFGHRKGAFTGAVRDKPGLLEAAHGGALFLDELTEMPKPIQAKLLRVIQDGI